MANANKWFSGLSLHSHSADALARANELAAKVEARVYVGPWGQAKLARLGDVLGPLLYLGRCPRCPRQHMSTHALVLPDGTCEMCANKLGKVL